MNSSTVAVHTQVNINDIQFENSRTVDFRNEFAFHLFYHIKLCKIPVILLTAFNAFLWLMVLVLWAFNGNVTSALSPLIQNTVITLLFIPAAALLSTSIAMLKTNGTVDSYRFLSDRIINTDSRGTKEFHYSDIIKVYETPKAFYIKTGRNSFCLIIKENFTKGDSTGFEIFLKNICGSKFRK